MGFRVHPPPQSNFLPAQHSAQVLMVTSAITHLDLQHNDIMASAMDTILRALSMNESLQSLLIGVPPIRVLTVTGCCCA